MLQDVNGDFTLEVDLGPLAQLVDNGATMAAGLLIWEDEQTFIRLERAANDGKANRIRLEAYQAAKLVLTKDWPTSPRRTQLQVVAKGNQFTFAIMEFPTDKTWRVLHSATLALRPGLKVGVHARNAVGSYFEAHFTALKIEGANRTSEDPSATPSGNIAKMPVPTADELAKKTSPFDAFKRTDIPAEVLAKLGSGNGETPNELVAVLGKAGDPQVVRLALTSDGRSLLTMALANSKARMFDVASRQQTKSFGGVQKTNDDVLAMSPDGGLLAIGTRNTLSGSVRVIETSTGKVRRTINLEKGGKAAKIAMSEMAFSSDNSLLAVGEITGKVRLWELASGTERMLNPSLAQLTRMSFSPDGKFLALAGWLEGYKGLEIVIQEVATDKPFGRLVGHSNLIRALAWHPGGQKLASASIDGSIRLWDVATRKQTQVLPPIGIVDGLAWHPTGELLTSFSHSSGTLTVWEMTGKTGRMRQPISLFPPDAASKAAAGTNHDVLFTPDGRHILAGNSNGTVSVLRLEKTAK